MHRRSEWLAAISFMLLWSVYKESLSEEIINKRTALWSKFKYALNITASTAAELILTFDTNPAV